MKILVACEFSGVVREVFTAKGHDAWSCDLLPTEMPGNHIQGNVIDILDDGWDMMIAHPPCTYLTVTANRWLKDQPSRKSGVLVGKERRDAVIDSASFFMKLARANIPRIVIENPVGVMSTMWRKPDQIIQPMDFGHVEPKKTCLWIKGLPLLKKTHDGIEPDYTITKSGKRMATWYYFADNTKGADRAKERSKTFHGIADAMAEQWGGDCEFMQQLELI